jgi:hypothetical protein
MNFFQKLGFIKKSVVKIPFNDQALVEEKPSFNNSFNDRFSDIDKCEQGYLLGLKDYTMTSLERQITFLRAIEYVLEHNIEGDIVECGVWRGGNMMLAARVLKSYNNNVKKLWLYDTFEGMPKPRDDKDFVAKDNTLASDCLSKEIKSKENSNVWAIADFQEVVQNVYSTGIDKDNVVFVKGLVEKTIPEHKPEKISILRLDTDWYSSTLHELNCLYPLVSQGGLVIIDDYGHWGGAKQATNEFLSNLESPPPFLHRIDYTCRMFQK